MQNIIARIIQGVKRSKLFIIFSILTLVSIKSAVYLGPVHNKFVIVFIVLALIATYVVMLRHIYRHVDLQSSNEVLGGLFLYVLMIIVFICLFQMIWAATGAYRCPDPLSTYNTFYLSAMTYSSVGFGDCVPTGEMGMLIAILESYISMIHTGVFLAFLVHAMNRHR